MSDLTLPDVLAVESGPWLAAADTWRTLAKALDRTDEQMIDGVRDLPEAWSKGTGSSAAAVKATTLRQRTNATYSPVKNIGDQLELHGYSMAALRRYAEQIIASAKEAGYTVDPVAMTVEAPASAYMGGNLDQTGRATGNLLNELREVVTRAQAQDDETAGILNGNVPGAPGGRSWAGEAGTIARAQELALKLKDPTYKPTAAELDELAELITEYGNDPEFAYQMLTKLGPQGLLELNGTLATYQLDRPGKDEDGWLFDTHRADTVKALQLGLGNMLETATERNGVETGPYGEGYIPGENELSSQWVADLMTAGRSTMTIGDPTQPGRSIDGVYGYQLLSPLLRNSDLDASFLTNVGGDMVDFEMSNEDKSAMWNTGRGENIRLDWTQDHDNDLAAAGYDPMNGLMEGLSKNGAATQDLLTQVTEFSADGPADGRLTRLDYLLTDRDWTGTPDVPGGPGFMSVLMDKGEDYQSSGLDKFGEALENATITHHSDDSRRLIESIIFETNVDETARGYENAFNANDSGKSEIFAKTDMVDPQLRDSMGRIMSSYISDVNQNMIGSVEADTFQVDKTHLTRFLADVGKDETAHAAIADAQAIYTEQRYQYILSGQQNPDADIYANLDAMSAESHKYGAVLGTIDYGAGLANHDTSQMLDDAANTTIENRYKFAGPVAEAIAGVATSRVPGASDLINGVTGEVLSQLEESQKVDSSGRTSYDVGTMLGTSRSYAAELAEAGLYTSGRLQHLPETLYQDGKLIPLDQLDEGQRQDWNAYRNGLGLDTVGRASKDSLESYESGYNSARNTFDNNQMGTPK
ncbi:DUF6571 family protein [Actinoplanes rectilineatus]|uniref:DUF6571 family protein n=1 Tax=Actinoplanes rectilineatus TaxID=113571 RepID=UPI0005F2FC85|nr:DUF6571 family protein [Actinoplanes rectilineatus]